jgi:aspartyl-tRNA(Asn)/glutamyl-tRNA(Gln) amidotransferase subunit C
MPTAFSREQVAGIAALAHLELDEGELELFARQLGSILAYANDVQRVDTAGVPPTASVVTGRTAERTDEIRPSLTVDDAIANAPDASADAGLFKVPRVIG